MMSLSTKADNLSTTDMSVRSKSTSSNGGGGRSRRLLPRFSLRRFFCRRPSMSTRSSSSSSKHMDFNDTRSLASIGSLINDTLAVKKYCSFVCLWGHVVVIGIGRKRIILCRFSPISYFHLKKKKYVILHSLCFNFCLYLLKYSHESLCSISLLFARCYEGCTRVIRQQLSWWTHRVDE